MITRLTKVLFIVLSCFVVPAQGQTLSVNIIVNTSVETTSLTTAQLRKLFSMRQTNWPNGQEVVVFVLNSDHPTHKALCRTILKMFPYQMEKLWNKLAFSGVSDRPIEVESEAQLLERVRNTPGAIGYTSLPIQSDDYHQVNVVGSEQ